MQEQFKMRIVIFMDILYDSNMTMRKNCKGKNINLYNQFYALSFIDLKLDVDLPRMRQSEILLNYLNNWSCEKQKSLSCLCVWLESWLSNESYRCLRSGKKKKLCQTKHLELIFVPPSSCVLNHKIVKRGRLQQSLKKWKRLDSNQWFQPRSLLTRHCIYTLEAPSNLCFEQRHFFQRYNQCGL